MLFVAPLTGCVDPNEPVDGAVEANAIVERIVDGDTVIVELEGQRERVRLIGIDTPESVDPRRPVECYGPEASQRLGELISAGTSVRLEVDREPRDDYGRILAYLYRASDGLFVNEAMVAEGYAETLVVRPNTTHSDRLAAAEREARRTGAGLWGACPR